MQRTNDLLNRIGRELSTQNRADLPLSAIPDPIALMDLAEGKLSSEDSAKLLALAEHYPQIGDLLSDYMEVVEAEGVNTEVQSAAPVENAPGVFTKLTNAFSALWAQPKLSLSFASSEASSSLITLSFGENKTIKGSAVVGVDQTLIQLESSSWNVGELISLNLKDPASLQTFSRVGVVRGGRKPNLEFGVQLSNFEAIEMNAGIIDVSILTREESRLLKRSCMLASSDSDSINAWEVWANRNVTSDHSATAETAHWILDYIATLS